MAEDFREAKLPELDERLRRAARSFAYPPTPDIAARARPSVFRRISPRLAWVLALIVLLGSLMLVSPVRAQVLEWLRIGAVKIFLVPQPTPSVTVVPKTLQNLAGETSLADAQAQASFPLMIPGYPPDLGKPQHVYFQQVLDARVVIFVWTEPGDAQKVRLVLYQIEGGDAFQKQLMQNMESTTVNGQWALWVEGPYLLTDRNGKIEERRIVTGHTLIWLDNGITYRLETDLPLEAARKIAGSLVKLSP